MVMIHSTQPIRGVLDGQEHHHVIWSCLAPFRFSPFAPKSRTAFHVMYGTQKQMAHCLLCFGIYASDRKLNIARKGTGIDLKQSSIYSFTKRNNNAVRSILMLVGSGCPCICSWHLCICLQTGRSWFMSLPYMCPFTHWFLLGSWQLPVTPITHMDPLLGCLQFFVS